MMACTSLAWAWEWRLQSGTTKKMPPRRSEVAEPLIIYHGNCYDGFTALWVAHRRFGGEIEAHAGKYGEPPPDVTSRYVYVLDFSYPRDVMEKMFDDAESLVVLDHHKTAKEACEGLPYCAFDMERSGCRMAWDFFFPGEKPPEWLLRVEDRDLWRFKYHDTKFVHAFIASLPMTIESWENLDAIPYEEIGLAGEAIRQYIDTYLKKAAQEARGFEWLGHKVVALNIPYQNASEAADVMLGMYPHARFSVGYFQRGDGRWQFSLRSRGDFDVSEFAKQFGGGGHAGAAGFDLERLPVEFL